jgi:uncharacterized protein YqgV (UPF0045/DUF77 family)
MRALIEISMYPLSEGFVAPIEAFIGRLRRYEGLEVQTNPVSTRVWGDYDLVLDAVTREMRAVHQDSDRTVVFVMKVLSPGGRIEP